MVRTGAIFNSLTYGGIDSADYGIYISGEGVYNAPERAVELVSVPGRNGAIAIDQGHWENIEVTYPAGVFGSDKTDFATAISSFRNAILSQKGYRRLTDTYHPDEYREGLYISGLEVDPVRMTTAGEFDLVFNCKPQRFLTVGETKTTITSGDEINNPTQYDSSPMIEATGYGTITVGEKEIEIENTTFGETQVSPAVYDKVVGSTSISYTIPIDTTKMNVGDSFTVSGLILGNVLYNIVDTSQDNIVSVAIGATSNATAVVYNVKPTYANSNLMANDAAFINGTASTFTFSFGINAEVKHLATQVITTDSAALSVTMHYDGNQTISFTANRTGPNLNNAIFVMSTISWDTVYADSTKMITGNPTYIDCDLGECYKIENGTIIDLNRYIDLGSDLPKLAPGANEITFDNTITKLEIVPRWWIL